MKLRQVEIENFRCFERLTVSLENDVTAFIGVNAAGKTAILDAIALALHPLLEGAFRRRHRNTKAEPWDIEDERGSSLERTDIRIGTADVAGTGGQFPRVVIRTTVDAEPSETGQTATRIEWQQEMGFRQQFADLYSGTSWVAPPGVVPAPQGLWVPADPEGGVHVSIPTLAYYRAHRRFSRMPSLGDVFGDRLDPDAAFAHALDASADFEAMCRWFYMRENQELRAKLKHRDDPDFAFADLKAIRNVLNLMLDGIDRIYFDDNPPRLKVDKADAQGSSQALEVEQLSDGQRNLLALALDFARRLAQANPGWDEPLQAPGILLIDEVELHLHPKWQQNVIPHLRCAFPNTQIIVATHSPQVVTTLEARQVRVLRDLRLFPSPVETFGADAGRAQRLVMETETRPPENPFTKQIEQLFERINEDDLSEADRLLQYLESGHGGDDPTLIEARTLIDNRKWEKELGL